MRIFQSLWTKPALDKRWDTSGQLESNIWLYTLSVIYAKSIGVEIVLHTDSLGKALLSHLPYDKIYTTLNNIPETIPTMIWAYGKFEALKQEPLGSIHIDGDVFLKKPEVLKGLEYSNYDLIVQNTEGLGYSYENTEKILDKYGIISSESFNVPYAYNCGVIGINNAQLKKMYLDFYLKYTKAVSQNRVLKNMMAHDKYICVDLPLEQHSIAVLSKNFKVKQLLENGGGEAITNLTVQSSIKLGYQHLIGKEKYNHIERVKAYVLALNRDLYYKTKKVIEKYSKLIN